MPPNNPYLVERLQGFGTTIFSEMSALALETGSINLGQGFPDTDGPDEVREIAIEAVRSGYNQYPPGLGVEALRKAISVHQGRFYGLDIDPVTEVLVTAGATEAIAASLLALVEPGQEVVTFEPYYDSYAAAIALAGGVRRVVTLRPPDYRYDIAELEAAIGPRTRLLLLNSPHNPTGKVFDREELAQISKVAIENEILVVTDEVYEHLIFDGREHVPIVTMPGMADRTVTISSGGKSFSLTGWKIGWLHGSAELVSAIRTVKQFLTYVSGGPFQHAIAAALLLRDSYFEDLKSDMEAKRDLFCSGLTDIGFDVFRPAGTYFATVDIRPLDSEDGISFCLGLPERCGVVAVPTSLFYDDPEAGRHLVRFAFCKKPEVLCEAIDRLSVLKTGGVL